MTPDTSSPTPDPAEARTVRFLGIPVLKPIATGQKRVPWVAVTLLSLVWFTFGFHIFAGGMAVSYTLRKYNPDPRVISLITVIPTFVMLGPFISYISDMVWTRFGRRRPFLFVAWASSCAAMSVFAFLPEVTAWINGVFGTVGFPFITEFMLLVLLYISYTTLADMQAPLEPLFLEVVPPDQRGRFFAIRGVLFSLAVMLFYQVLFPFYDERVDVLAWLGYPAGTLALRGEQLIYILDAGLFFLTGIFLFLNIHETPVPGAPNKRFRELFLDAGGKVADAGASSWSRLVNSGFVRFFVRYFRDVFLNRDCYAFYVILVIPGVGQAVWGQQFDAFMKEFQFGYSKANLALLGFPAMLIGMVVLTPFAGWFSDAKPCVPLWLRWVIGLASAGCLAAVYPVYHAVAPDNIRELPALPYCMLLCGLVAAGTMGCFVLILELVLDRVGRQHMRLWVSLLASVKDLILQGVYFSVIHFFAGDHVPAITFWMVLSQVGGTLGALMGTFVGPMIYEYMPRSKMGTINAGKGWIEGLLRTAVGILGAQWMYFFSLHIFKPQGAEYNYASLYLIQMVFQCIGLAAVLWFVREVRRGSIRQWGIIEVLGDDAVPGDQSSKTGRP